MKEERKDIRGKGRRVGERDMNSMEVAGGPASGNRYSGKKLETRRGKIWKREEKSFGEEE